jgi:hypothetical protein
MAERRYYSIRTGKHPTGAKLDLPMLLRLFYSLFCDFERKGYFQEAFGYTCVDVGDVNGTIGPDIEAYLFLKLRKDNLWPINDKYRQYTEEDLFDIIELLYDHISKPTHGKYHDWNECGWHYDKFDRDLGQEEFRIRINEILKDYQGFELAKNGEILSTAISGAEDLFLPAKLEYDTNNIDNRIERAVLKFRRYHSSLDDKKDSVKELADVLEFLRPKLGMAITKKDEGDLFNIANNFGIRHHNEKQKTDYDKEIWLDWMFYHYIATLNTIIRMLKKAEQTNF